MSIRENRDLSSLAGDYLFARTGAAAARFRKEHPEARVIDLGIGDVTLPVAPCVSDAVAAAAWEMAKGSTFRGYGPYAGYPFLRRAVAEEYAAAGVPVLPEEVYVTSGAKEELFSLLSLFARGITALVQDPVYPAYADANRMLGNRVLTVTAGQENGFVPLPGREHGELIYLCSPNNPTGAVLGWDALAAWVARAREDGALILFDSAYRSFVQGDAPRSIFAIEGARQCAVEVGSFSKSAGFTGLRCGWTVVPRELSVGGIPLRELYERRIAIAGNGVSYLTQRAAEAALSPKGKKREGQCVACYKKNARMLKQAIEACGLPAFGGDNAPYVWFACPRGMDSEETFSFLLEKAALVTTPGSGFGPAGRGYMRLSSFCRRADALEAAERLTHWIVGGEICQK